MPIYTVVLILSVFYNAHMPSFAHAATVNRYAFLELLRVNLADIAGNVSWISCILSLTVRLVWS